MMRDLVWKIVAILVILIIVGGMFAMRRQHHHDYIRDWAKEHECKVVQIEFCAVALGPFYYRGKEHMIYKVAVEQMGSEKLVWFRLGSLFGPNIVWEKET